MRTPTFRELTKEECLAVLGRHTYGRLAFMLNNQVDLEPIHYALEGEWLYLRTTRGAKVASLQHDPWIAFEVDEVRGPFDWTSVVVKGTAYLLTAENGGADRKLFDKAVAALRRHAPQTLTPEDPAPERNLILRISINEIRGRAAGVGS